MSRNITRFATGWSRKQKRWATIGVASTTAAAVGLGVVFGAGAGTALADTSTAPVVTRAALDPSLVTGRGATVDFVEQEAENAATNGSIVGPDRTAYSLAAEASGRTAVKLTPGQYVEFTLPKAANAITVRYSIPDAPTGGGITAPLEITGSNGPKRTMTLTSQYSYLYNQYPFTNDPNAELLHADWWITECFCVPQYDNPSFQINKPFRPMKYYDEQRLLLGKTYKAGDKIRLTSPANSNAAWTVIDLLDSEVVGLPTVKLAAINVLLTGADPFGKKDSAPAFDKAIAAAKKAKLPVYIPPGVYQVNRHIVVDNVTIQGAGSWYTIIKGKEVALSAPLPDQSIHTGVGFYGKYAADGGSSNVHLSGFAIEGDVRERIDTDQVNGIGGVLNNSTVDGLYIHHTKVGLWFDGPMTNLKATNNIIVDQIADGLNFHDSVTNSVASNNFVRNTGDDALAMWSQGTGNANNTFDHNTVQTPTLANGIALYGGKDLTVSNNLVADPIREGAGLHLGSRFDSTPFQGTIAITNNTTVRASTFELNWHIGLGAIWIFALQGTIDADVQVVGDNFLDNTYNAMMMVADWGVKDLYSIKNVHFKDIKVDGAGTDVVSARAMGEASFENVDARNIGWWGVNNCGAFHWDWANGSEFTIHDLGGNDGVDNNAEYHPGTNWIGYYLPNAITCNDQPTVIMPPAPSTWVQPVG